MEMWGQEGGDGRSILGTGTPMPIVGDMVVVMSGWMLSKVVRRFLVVLTLNGNGTEVKYGIGNSQGGFHSGDVIPPAGTLCPKRPDYLAAPYLSRCYRVLKPY